MLISPILALFGLKRGMGSAATPSPTREKLGLPILPRYACAGQFKDPAHVCDDAHQVRLLRIFEQPFGWVIPLPIFPLSPAPTLFRTSSGAAAELLPFGTEILQIRGNADGHDKPRSSHHEAVSGLPI